MSLSGIDDPMSHKIACFKWAEVGESSLWHYHMTRHLQILDLRCVWPVGDRLDMPVREYIPTTGLGTNSYYCVWLGPICTFVFSHHCANSHPSRLPFHRHFQEVVEQPYEVYISVWVRPCSISKHTMLLATLVLEPFTWKRSIPHLLTSCVYVKPSS